MGVMAGMPLFSGNNIAILVGVWVTCLKLFRAETRSHKPLPGFRGIWEM